MTPTDEEVGDHEQRDRGESMTGDQRAEIAAPGTMPEPDALVADKHGNLCAAMFYFAPCDFDLGIIAAECGFDCISVRMADELGAAHDMSIAYENGDGEVVDKWEPKTPDGWSFGIKCDSDAGPFAIFVRRRKNTGEER